MNINIKKTNPSNTCIVYHFKEFSTLFQNPPSDHAEQQGADLHWAIPKISGSERYFLCQLISSPSKDVRIDFMHQSL